MGKAHVIFIQNCVWQEHWMVWNELEWAPHIFHAEEKNS